MKRHFQYFFFLGLLLCLPKVILAQQKDYPPLEHGYYYAVAGVFQEEANALKRNEEVRLTFSSAYISLHPETGLFYLLLDKTTVPSSGKISEIRQVKGFEEVWLYHFLTSSPTPAEPIPQEPSRVEGGRNNNNKPLELKAEDLPDSLSLLIKDAKMVASAPDTAFQRNENLADSTNRALDLLMRSASVSNSSPPPTASREKEREVPQGDKEQGQEKMPPNEKTGFAAFDVELPRLENNLYTSEKASYEEEFSLIFQTDGLKNGEQLDVELLDGNQEVRFMRLAPNQLHQVRVPKDAMRDLVLRGVLDDGYTFSLGLDLLVLFYSKELNSKILQVTERNLVLFPPAEFSDNRSPRYVFYFQNGSSVLERSCRYELNELVRFLKEHPERGVSITGYTNAGGMGRAWKNIHDDFFKVSDLTIKQDAHAMELAMDRASMVQRYLIKQGIAPGRIQVEANTSRRLFQSRLFEGRFNARAEVFID